MTFRLLGLFGFLMLPALAQQEARVIEITRQENASELKRLLDSGANADAKSGSEGHALHIAAKKGNLRLVETLANGGATIDAKDRFGWTALLVAASDGFFPIVELLHQRGADLNATDSDGITALMWAAVNGHTNIVKYLLRNKAEVNARDSRERTALDFVRFDESRTAREIAQLIKDLGGKKGKPTSVDQVPVSISRKTPAYGAEQAEGLDEIITAIRERRFSDAHNLIDEKLDQKEANRPAYLEKRFDAFYLEEKFDQCLVTLETMRKDGASPSTLSKMSMTLARVLTKTEDMSGENYKKAEQLYLRELEANNIPNMVVLQNLAATYAQWQRYEDALKVYKKMLTLDPTDLEKQRIERLVEYLMAKAPPIEMDDNGGLLRAGNIDFSAFRGQAVALAFWMSEGECSLNSIPVLRRVHRKFSGDYFQLIGIFNENESTAQPVIEREEMVWNQLDDKRQITKNAFDVRLYPTWILIDHEGKIIHREIPCTESKRNAFYIEVSRATKRAKKAAKRARARE